MKIFELILTDSCTRQCSFCYVKQTGYIETLQNINIFINCIIDYHKKTNDIVQINLFGGEPLLNLNGINLVINTFKNCLYANIIIYTNGDLIKNLIQKIPQLYLIKNLKFHITAYDIFNELYKYKYYISQLKINNCQLSYTFTQNDIDKIFNFIDICKKLHVNYHINISHAQISWNDISSNKQYQILYNIYNKEFEQIYQQSIIDCKSMIVSSFIYRYFSRAIELIFNFHIQEYFCISESKYVFYKGKFIGPCIRLYNLNYKSYYELRRCNSCIYKFACFKSCVAEYKNNTIPIKLCNIEKAAFDAIFNNIQKYIHTDKMKELISFELCESKI